MSSLTNEFMQLAQNYSDFLEGTDWGSEASKIFVASSSVMDLAYSELLEDTDWN